LPEVPHVQNPDRVAAANRCIDDHSATAIVLDDGFQHRRLGRDLDVVLIDASNPFGYGHLIPAGLLREPIKALGRADVVVITRCDRVDGARISEVRNQIESVTTAPIALSRTMAKGLIQQDSVHTNCGELKSGSWFVFSAIGNHEAFESSLRELGCNIVGAMRFRDHHLFDEGDHESLVAKAQEAKADFLICTHKDLVKINPKHVSLPVFALQTELDIFEGKQEFSETILRLFTPLETLK